MDERSTKKTEKWELTFRPSTENERLLIGLRSSMGSITIINDRIVKYHGTPLNFADTHGCRSEKLLQNPILFNRRHG